MTDRDNRCLRFDGLTKASYYSMRKARRAARLSNTSSLFDRSKGKVSAYKCNCGLYHIGHSLYRGRERNPD
jgi:hypothetical protein